MKVLSIVGARPQFIKAALTSRKIREKGLREILVHTGQHYDFNMSEIFFQQLNLPKPDHHLGVGSGRHGEQTAKMLIETEKVLLQEKPDIVLVYGDTNTTLAGALAAVKLHIPLAHVEAGLRSFNKKMPEEINRIVADHCSDILFCPTETAAKNLQAEGFTNVANDGKLISRTRPSVPSSGPASPLVINVGDVMFDIALQVQKLTCKGKGNAAEILKEHSLKSRDYILVTIHRAENTDIRRNLKSIMEALGQIAKTGPRVFFPAHPRTKKALEKYDLLHSDSTSGITVSEPVSYLEMVALESNARLIITDSGGVQKEAYFFKVPCITPRKETEWTELVDIGWNHVVGAKKTSIVKAALAVLQQSCEDKKWAPFYGDGKACDRIARVLQDCL
jgi:UDP-N-acetylglucosamine 2-epimerase